MIDNNNNHLSSFAPMTTSQCAAKHIDIKIIRCKGESPELYWKHWAYKYEQMLADPLTKCLPPTVFREHTVDMGLRKNLWFSDNKEPKVKESVSEQRRVL
jgi:hypothetical protein